MNVDVLFKKKRLKPHEIDLLINSEFFNSPNESKYDCSKEEQDCHEVEGKFVFNQLWPS